MTPPRGCCSSSGGAGRGHTRRLPHRLTHCLLWNGRVTDGTSTATGCSVPQSPLEASGTHTRTHARGTGRGDEESTDSPPPEASSDGGSRWRLFFLLPSFLAPRPPIRPPAPGSPSVLTAAQRGPGEAVRGRCSRVSIEASRKHVNTWCGERGDLLTGRQWCSHMARLPLTNRLHAPQHSTHAHAASCALSAPPCVG